MDSEATGERGSSSGGRGEGAGQEGVTVLLFGVNIDYRQCDRSIGPSADHDDNVLISIHDAVLLMYRCVSECTCVCERERVRVWCVFACVCVWCKHSMLLLKQTNSLFINKKLTGDLASLTVCLTD